MSETATPDPPGPKLYEVVRPGSRATCRSCGAAIDWGVTEKGKTVPLSLRSPYAEKVDGRVVRAPSHFTDCPNAGQHSRRNA